MAARIGVSGQGCRLRRMRIDLATLPTPLGAVHLAAHPGGVLVCEFDEGAVPLLTRLRDQWPQASFGQGGSAAAPLVQLERYFDGALDALDGIAVDPQGTGFQKKVWAELRRIPAGATWSYLELARRVSTAGAVRAVGSANARNPVGIVIPCHRVIASDGTLCGYAGGLARKAWLLGHEGALPAQRRLPLAG